MSRISFGGSAQQPPQLRIGNYSLDKTVGSGSFGKVKKGYHLTTGVPVAIKIINKDKLAKKQDMDQKIRREIYNLRRFRHPHIIKLYEVIETQTDIFLVMELVGGGELFDYIIQRGKLSEVEARLCFQQMISAVGYCHHHKVAHRDLKPENLLLSSSTNALKIADFGLSNLIQDGEFLQTSCGSPNYAAPEVIDGKYYSGEEIDVWSSGVILYALLTARLPFDDDYIPHLFSKIKRGKYKMPQFLSGPCQNLIQQMLNVDPLKRITIPEIKQHPWFVQDLPAYLRDFPEDNIDPHEMFQTANLDEHILQELQHMYNMSRPKLLQELSREVEAATSSASGSSSSSGGLMAPQSSSQSASASSLSSSATFGSPLDEPLSRSNPLMVAYLLLYDQAENDMTPAAAIRRQVESGASRNSYSRDSVAQSLAQLSTSPAISLRDEIPFLDAGPELNVLAAMNSAGPLSHLHSDTTPSISAASLDAAASAGNSVQVATSADGSAHKRPWYLGILSRKTPIAIMREVYRALKKLNFEWKIISPYQIQARIIQPKTTLASSGNLTTSGSFSPIPTQHLLAAPTQFVGSHQSASHLSSSHHSGQMSPHSQLSSSSSSLRNSPSQRPSPKSRSRTSHVEVPQQKSSPTGVYDHSDTEDLALVNRGLVSSPSFNESASISPPYVKLMIQLFKVNPRKDSQVMVHLLDIKKLQGEPIAFFDLCGTLMQEIQL